MDAIPDVTESLLERTKKLLEMRGDVPLRQIAEGAGVGHEWLRSLAYREDQNPTIKPLEQLHNYLVEFYAAKRFQEREARAP